MRPAGARIALVADYRKEQRIGTESPAQHRGGLGVLRRKKEAPLADVPDSTGRIAKNCRVRQ
jgi:hypothetical protein